MNSGLSADGGEGGVADSLATWAVPLIGLLLVVLGVLYWRIADMTLFSMAIASLPGALTAVAWVGVRRVDRDDGYGRRLLGYTVAGAVALGGLILVTVLVQGGSLFESYPLLQFMVGIGTLSGLLVGGNEVRRVDAARRAERARMEAELSQRELERLEFLNHLLRHHVLNKMNVIDGYATVVREGGEDAFDEELATIHEETTEVTELIENVRVLVDTMTYDATLEPVDLAAVLEREVATLRKENPDVTVETDVPADCSVRGDELLRYVFENLLRNAVQHNDADEPVVEVTVTTTDHTVSVRIADDGPGIEPERREIVFDPEENASRGLGLYLADTLVTEYGGSISIEDSELGGAAFVVDLQRAV